MNRTCHLMRCTCLWVFALLVSGLSNGYAMSGSSDSNEINPAPATTQTIYLAQSSTDADDDTAAEKARKKAEEEAEQEELEDDCDD